MGKGNSKLQPETIEQLQEQTGYTRDEIKDWYKNFLADCPKGVLTKEEFETVYAQFFPTGDATKFSSHVFRTFDTDGNGTVDFREFLSGLSTVARGNIEQKLQWAFSMYDLDNNGEISRDEMLEIIKSIYKMRGKTGSTETPEMRANVLFDKLDKNRDDRVTMDEFVQGAKNDPSIIDLLKGSK